MLKAKPNPSPLDFCIMPTDEKKPDYFERLETLGEQYLRDRIQLLKLEATEKSATVGSAALVFFVVAMLAMFMLFFVSLMGAYYFAELTGSLFYGFSIVTGIYFLLLILVLALRKNTITPKLTNLLIRLFWDKMDDEHEPTEPLSGSN